MASQIMMEVLPLLKVGARHSLLYFSSVLRQTLGCEDSCFSDLIIGKRFGPWICLLRLSHHGFACYMPTLLRLIYSISGIPIWSSFRCTGSSKKDIETLYHLFVSCSPRLNFWFSISERYFLPDKFLTVDKIWSVLISFVPVDEQYTVDTDALCFFSAGIATLWKTTAAVKIFEL